MSTYSHDRHGHYKGDRSIDPNRIIAGRPAPKRTYDFVKSELDALQQGFLSLMADDRFGGATTEELCSLSRRIAKLEDELQGLTNEIN